MAEETRRTWLGSTISRRRLITTTSVAAVGGVAVAGCTGQDTTQPVFEGDVSIPDRSAPPPPTRPQTLRFLSTEEARTVESFAARIMPGSPDDPGAVEAGGLIYIDAKLADYEDFPAPTYHEAPFANVAGGIVVPEDQLDRYGFQSHLTPREMYRAGLLALDGYCQVRFGAPFHQLDEAQQDEILVALDDAQQASGAEGSSGGAGGIDDEADEMSTPPEDGPDLTDAFGEVDPGEFFSMVRLDTIEGMFSDPVYGGNRDMVGWRLIGWPGSQRSYSPYELLHGTDKEPQPMHELDAMNPDRPGGQPAIEQRGQHREH